PDRRIRTAQGRAGARVLSPAGATENPLSVPWRKGEGPAKREGEVGGFSACPPHPEPLPPMGGEGEEEKGRAVHGVAEITFSIRDGASRLSHLYERNPLRVLFPGGDL